MLQGEIFLPPSPVSFPEMCCDVTVKILFYPTFGRKGLVKHYDVRSQKPKLGLGKVVRGAYVLIYIQRHSNSAVTLTGKYKSFSCVWIFFFFKVAQKSRHSTIVDNNYVMVSSAWSEKRSFLWIYPHWYISIINKRWFRKVFILSSQDLLWTWWASICFGFIWSRC